MRIFIVGLLTLAALLVATESRPDEDYLTAVSEAAALLLRKVAANPGLNVSETTSKRLAVTTPTRVRRQLFPRRRRHRAGFGASEANSFNAAISPGLFGPTISIGVSSASAVSGGFEGGRRRRRFGLRGR